MHWHANEKGTLEKKIGKAIEQSRKEVVTDHYFP